MHEDPLDLFRAAVTALNREDWRAVALLCDPQSLEAFKTDLLHDLEPPKPGATLTATEMIKAVPGMPRAVAEYQVQRFREQLDPGRRLREETPSVDSRRKLEGMKPVDVFAAWIEGRSFKRQVERSFDRKQMSRVMANEILSEQKRKIVLEPLGFVDAGKDTRYIVFRRDERDLKPGTVMIKRQPDGAWAFVASRHFLRMDHVAIHPTMVETDESDESENS